MFTTPAQALRIAVPENKAQNSVLFTVEANDEDGDTLTYDIKTILPSSNRLTVSGAELQVSTGLDYESESSYSITFVYVDQRCSQTFS